MYKLACVSMRRVLLITLLVLVTVFAVPGVMRLQFSDDYGSFFSSDATAYQQLQQLTAVFGSEEDDLLLVVEAPDVLSPAGLDAIRHLAAGAREVEGVASVYSLINLPQASAGPAGVERLRTHPLLVNRLLSADARLSVLVLRLGSPQLEQVAAAVDRVQALARDVSQEPDIQVRLTGLPAIRVAIIRQLQQDMLLFNVIALLFVGGLGFLIFRRVSALVILGVAPALGVLWTIGVLGWMGQPIDVLTSVLPSLVLVIGFADAVHLLVHFQHGRREGLGVREASRAALRQVGGACALAAGTTAIGFASFATVPLDIIQRFGLACALGVGCSFLAVVTVVPLLSGTWLGTRVRVEQDLYAPSTILRRWFQSMRASSRLITTGAVILMIFLLVSALSLRPDWWYAENLPRRHEAAQALADADETLGGTMPVYAHIQWDDPARYDRSLIEVLQAVEARFEAEPRAHAPLSILGFLREIPVPIPLAERLPLVAQLPDSLGHRWVRADVQQAIVSAQVANKGAAALAPGLEALRRAFEEIEAEHPGFRIQLTGLSVLATTTSLDMIDVLARSLGVALVLIFGVILLFFRSLRLALVSLLPNVFPLVAVAALLVWVGEPLRYASVVVFSIALGIAVNDTIHLLSAFLRARREGKGVASAVEQSVAQVGRAIIITTVLLVGGFGTLVLSGLPGTQLFGLLACVALVLALVADLFILPALLLTVFGRKKG